MFESILGSSIIFNAIIAVSLYLIYMLEDHTDWLWVYQVVHDATPHQDKLMTLLVGSAYYTVMGSIVWLLLLIP
jgi:hypothetical protein